MDYLQFMNSKTLFKVSGVCAAVPLCPQRRRLSGWAQFQRKDPAGKNRLPVMVHINYHPDKARSSDMPARFLPADSCARSGSG